MFSFGKSKAQVVAEGDTGVRFSDVAGADESKIELEEVVDFLLERMPFRPSPSFLDAAVGKPMGGNRSAWRKPENACCKPAGHLPSG